MKKATYRSIRNKKFSDFLNFNISPYQRRDLPVSFVGSIAYYFESELREAADKTGFLIGSIEQSPLNGLIKFEKYNEHET